MMLLQYYFLIFFIKNICCGYSFELPRQDKNICYGYSFELRRLFEAIQMSSHNICFIMKQIKVH